MCLTARNVAVAFTSFSVNKQAVLFLRGTCLLSRFMEVGLKFPFLDCWTVENNSSASFTVRPLIVPPEQRDAMWRSTGRRCGWETSSGCDATRSSPPTCCCWAPATPTACATSRPPPWMERPTWSRDRWSAASTTWWDGCSSLPVCCVFSFLSKEKNF